RAVATGCRAKNMGLGHGDVYQLRTAAISGDSDPLAIDNAFVGQFGDGILEACSAREPEQLPHPLWRERGALKAPRLISRAKVGIQPAARLVDEQHDITARSE